MLERIFIRDLVTIEKQEIFFENGLNIITGETGSGKSLLFKAIKLICGEKSDKELIHPNSEDCIVEGSFLNPSKVILSLLEEIGLLDGHELVIRRRISRDGKNQIFINNFKSSLKALQSLAAVLINIHSQNSQFEILKKKYNISHLDFFAGIQAETQEYLKKYEEFKSLIEQRKTFEIEKEENEKQKDFLQFQYDEIKDANLSVEEEKELYEKNKKIEQLEKLQSHLNSVLSDGEYDVLPSLENQLSSLEEASRIDTSLTNHASEMKQAIIILQDVKSEVQSQLASLDFSENEINLVQERLAEIEKLKRKYGNDVSEVLSFFSTLEHKLNSLQEEEEFSSELSNKIELLQKQLRADAQVLSEKRKKILPEFQNYFLRELANVGLEKADFRIEFQEENKTQRKLNKQGIDDVVFKISMNPGIEAVELEKVASGGELSRMVLALKSMNQEFTGSSTLIFDEVDAGISGETAEKVGLKLKRLSFKQQVICITHLAQIACKADRHLKVEKTLEENRTISRVKSLHFDDRVQEISRFIGGGKNSQSYLNAAKEMLENSQTLVDERS